MGWARSIAWAMNLVEHGAQAVCSAGCMTADREVELKFLCTPADLGAVLAAAPAGDDESRELISVYFDTPDLALQKAGVSLRVRESKGTRVQTVKRGEGMSREEHEAAITGEEPDPELGPLQTHLPEGGRIVPAYTLRVTRRQRTFHYRGAEIELALDQGEVTDGTGRSPICEVELELKSGPPEALFALGRELSKAAPLYLSFDGKASRGQALVAGETLQARRGDDIALTAGATAAEAFQAIARNALGQIAANASVLRVEPREEAVHQLRVAARRLRSALSTFKPLVDDGGLSPVKGDLRWLAGSLDEARDLDVFAASVSDQAKTLAMPPPGLDALTAALEAARRRRWAKAAKMASSARFRALMIDVAAWVETGSWLAASPTPAKAFAAHALRARLRKVHKRGKHLAKADDAARHRLRIEAKKLRYAAEAFASLYGRRSAKRFIGRVKDLQTTLGDLNDLAVAGALVASLKLEPEAAFAAGELIGLRMAAKDQLIAKAEKTFRRLADVDLPFA
jgi:inorganic triphosphatase YgiF